jgi:hypothetical protein
MVGTWLTVACGTIVDTAASALFSENLRRGGGVTP